MEMIQVLITKNFVPDFQLIGGGVIFDFSVKDISFHISSQGLEAFHLILKVKEEIKLPNNEAGVYSTTEVNYLGELRS